MKWLLAVALVLPTTAGCAERQIDHPDADLLPVCMLYPARGWDEQGNATFIVDPDGSTGRTCECMTPEEFEQDLRLDVLHERALQECLQLAADYETNDCQEMHDEGGWLLSALLATGKEAWLTIGKDIPCSEQATTEQGCTITDDRPSPLALLALALFAAARRRPRD